MKKISKIISVVLAMLMACSCFAVISSAEEVDDYENLKIGDRFKVIIINSKVIPCRDEIG